MKASSSSIQNYNQLELLPTDSFDKSQVNGELKKHSVETFELDKSRGEILRKIHLRNGGFSESRVRVQVGLIGADEKPDLASLYDASWLRMDSLPSLYEPKEALRLVDLFSGCGAMSLGVFEACRALGIGLKPLLSVDINSYALDVYGANFPSARCLNVSVESIIDGDFSSPMTSREKELFDSLGKVDILIGGPPCQGHSDLNNHTRRSDPKNALIHRMVRFAEIFRPKYILIENVQGIRRDKGQASIKAKKNLEELGYQVEEGLVLASTIGVPQKRRRFCMVASLSQVPNIEQVLNCFGVEERSVGWACLDLLEVDSKSVFDTSSVHSRKNQERIAYLFKHALYELPDEMRPDCHRLKKHSYRSVYGRMKWDEPAPTITTGFGSTGQGRFVHPLRPRTLTPHEAARIQFIPDFFRFDGLQRRQLQEVIGNAVPPKLAYAIMIELLR